MREFAERFYKCKRWQAVAREYAKSVGGLCEPCAAAGAVVPGQIVHHVVELTPENISDPEISLGWNNLELVCRSCHAARHRKKRNRRYSVDASGNIMVRG